MNRNALRFLLTAFIAGAAGLLSATFAPVFAQAIAPEANHGLPQDWSHKHLLYTNPDTRDEAARKGPLALDQWNESYKDPRFALQVARKTRFVQASENSPFSGQQLQWADRFRRDPPPAGTDIHRDWSNVLGGATGLGKAGVFPAKFQFNISATPSCASDFVVYTTTSAGATSTGTLTTWKGTFTGQPTAAQTVTITRTGSPALVLTATVATTGLNSGLNFEIGSTTTVTATNLAAAINRNGGTAGVTATSTAAVVTVSSITAGTTSNITLAKTLTNFTWAAPTAGTNAAGQPTIVAFNQLYSSCATIPVLPAAETQAYPVPFWSYNTGTGAVAQTSPVLSLDGTQVAFIQGTGTAGTAAKLVLLKWSSASPGTLGVPTVPNTATSAGNYRSGCALPCMWTIALSGTPAITNSSPFYDYTNDILYVGDDSGKLHKFTGVFSGTPAEITATWPVTVSTGNILSSPVYDSVSGLVYVGSAAGASSGGQLHSVNATTGALLSSAVLATASTVGVQDSPIVDSTAKKVYVFVGAGAAAANGTTCTGGPCMSVYQFAAPFLAGAAGTNVQVGRGKTSSPGNVLYAGGFDNTYYTSATPSSPSGNLYVCGGKTGTASRPTLWKIPISANAMGTPVVGPALVNGNDTCSPITEVFNSPNDYIYSSVASAGSATIASGGNACTGACIYLYNLTTWGGANWVSTATATDGLAATGGTSGIIVDNISTTTGASQIYYSTIGTGTVGNAVQASQAGLQ